MNQPFTLATLTLAVLLIAIGLLLRPIQRTPMPIHESYEENCQGCKPVILDIKTGRPFPADHPAVVAINAVFNSLPLSDKQAWHELTCHNSREPQVLAAMARVQKLFSDALEKAFKTNEANTPNP